MNNSQDKFALNKRPDVVIDNLFDRILISSDHTLGCINDHTSLYFLEKLEFKFFQVRTIVAQIGYW